LRKICQDLIECASNDFKVEGSKEQIQIGKTMVF